LRLAALIPTFNNGRTIRDVVERTLEQLRDVWVINDGSTDGTREALSSFGERIRILEHPRNLGKGRALRTGFDGLHKAGFTHAVTLDSDGQHSPEDLPLFLEAASKAPEAILVGQRDMKGAGVPWRSRFGLWFSNRTLKSLAGVRLGDSQCGFRCYPLAAVSTLDLRGERYDLELEILLRASWSGVRLEPVPVQVTYDPFGGRVTHFRPVRDFLQIARQVAGMVCRGRK
jgi:glycosyltransferase involved in cell wall biosynthesis